jgi:methylated-DNA-[protein]-cysteine S-methyltransferase
MTARINLLAGYLETPIGQLAIVASEQGTLRAVGWSDGHARMDRQLLAFGGSPAYRLVEASDPGGFATALRAYFAGDLAAIDDLPVAAEGTEFQRTVWRALRDIPSGETCSYADIARRIGRPRAVRAVGLANGANPVALVVPCHRVIGASGALTGYGGGLDRKRWLLEHERRALGPVALRRASIGATPHHEWPPRASRTTRRCRASSCARTS